MKLKPINDKVYGSGKTIWESIYNLTYGSTSDLLFYQIWESLTYTLPFDIMGSVTIFLII